jgi:hypothetical protein
VEQELIRGAGRRGSRRGGGWLRLPLIASANVWDQRHRQKRHGCQPNSTIRSDDEKSSHATPRARFSMRAPLAEPRRLLLRLRRQCDVCPPATACSSQKPEWLGRARQRNAHKFPSGRRGSKVAASRIGLIAAASGNSRGSGRAIGPGSRLDNGRMALNRCDPLQGLQTATGPDGGRSTFSLIGEDQARFLKSNSISTKAPAGHFKVVRLPAARGCSPSTILPTLRRDCRAHPTDASFFRRQPVGNCLVAILPFAH